MAGGYDIKSQLCHRGTAHIFVMKYSETSIPLRALAECKNDGSQGQARGS